MRIGIVSDTHGLLRPKVLEMLSGTDHIIHGGDIGSAGIVPRLRAIAPTTAIRGNVDTAAWARVYPSQETIELANRSVHVLHDLHDLDLVRRQRSWDRLGFLRKGGFLAHRNRQGGEDETEIRATQGAA